MGWDTLRLDWDGGAATITIDRPERMNALNADTLSALEDILNKAEASDARVVVLTDAGDEAFIAGAGIGYMKDIETPAAQNYTEQGRHITTCLEGFPAPTVTTINSYALGGGMKLMLACGLRVASKCTLLGQTEADLGIVPGWGGNVRLPALVNDGVARRLIFFGECIDANGIHEYGIVGEVVTHDRLDSRVEDLVADLALKPRHVLAGTKATINMSHNAPRDAAFDFEARTWSGLFGTCDQRERMEAFLDKHNPDFEQNRESFCFRFIRVIRVTDSPTQPCQHGSYNC